MPDYEHLSIRRVQRPPRQRQKVRQGFRRDPRYPQHEQHARSLSSQADNALAALQARQIRTPELNPKLMLTFALNRKVPDAKFRVSELTVLDSSDQHAAVVFASDGEMAAFKRRLAELLLPSAVIALARGDEMNPLLTAFARMDAPEVWRVPVHPEAGRKTTAARTTRRAARFLAALADAQTLTFSLDEVALQGTWLGTGEPLPHHLALFLSQSLGRPALHAERTPGGGLYVVLNGEGWDSAGLAAVESHFQTRAVSVTAAQKFARLLVGLVSSGGALLGLGLIERIDFGRRTLSVLTPCRKPAAVAQVWLGALRLRPDGREIGEVRPGEV